MFLAVCSAPCNPQHIAVPPLKFSSIDMEFNNKDQRLTDCIFNKENNNEDSMDYNYDLGVGGSILYSSFGGIGGGIGAHIWSAYLSSCGLTCKYREAAERKRKAAVTCFVAISSGGSNDGSRFSANSWRKKRTTTAASFLLPPPLPPPSPAVGSNCSAVVDVSNDTDPVAAAITIATNPNTKFKARKVAKAMTRAKVGKKLKPARGVTSEAAPYPSSCLALPSTPDESDAVAVAADDTPASVTPAVVSQTVKKIVSYTTKTEELFLVSACAQCWKQQQLNKVAVAAPPNERGSHCDSILSFYFQAKYRSRILNARDVRAEELVARIISLVELQIPSDLVPDKKRQTLEKAVLAKIDSTFSCLKLMLAPLTKAYMNQREKNEMDELLYSMAVPQILRKEKRRIYGLMFSRLLEDPDYVNFATGNR
jgi:hypothetical protein